MTPKTAKEITFRKCLTRLVYLDDYAHYVQHDTRRTFDPATGITTLDLSAQISEMFRLEGFDFVNETLTPGAQLNEQLRET